MFSVASRVRLENHFSPNLGILYYVLINVNYKQHGNTSCFVLNGTRQKISGTSGTTGTTSSTAPRTDPLAQLLRRFRGTCGMPSLFALNNAVFSEKCKRIVENQGGRFKTRGRRASAVDPVLFIVPLKPHRYTKCITRWV